MPTEELYFEDAQRDAALRAALARASERPQLVVLHGPAGSGKSQAAERALQGGDWLTIQVSNSRMSRLVLATIAMALTRECQPEVAAHLTALLLHPGTLEEDVVKVALALASLPRPVALVLDHAQNAPVELASLLEFLFATPSAGSRALLLLSRAAAEDAPLCRSLLRRLEPGQCLSLEMAPPSLGSVQQALEPRFPGEDATALRLRAAVLLQRSEGNLLHLLHLLRGGEPLRAAGRLPEAVRHNYAGEIDGWGAALRDHLGQLSVINGSFDAALAGAALGAADVGKVLREALERRILCEVEEERALRLSDLTPLPPITCPVAWAQPEPRYRFCSEGLRVTLASRVPHSLRQEVRRRLVPLLADTEPGLALYYAERAGLSQHSEPLRRAYHERLPEGSPLRGLPELAEEGGEVTLAAPPRRSEAAPGSLVKWQGYLLSWEQGGWLNVVSQGLYGNPHTLKLRLDLPAVGAATALDVQLVWRLDVFHGGEELGPTLAPFPLRLGLLGADSVQVLAEQVAAPYAEEGVTRLTHTGVKRGRWLAHRLSLPPSGEGPATLELSVRALDVALTLAELRVNGRSLLPLSAAPATRPSQDWRVSPAASLPVQP